MPAHREHSRLDAWMAMLAGRGPWKTAEARHRSWSDLLTAFEVAALVVTGVSVVRTSTQIRGLSAVGIWLSLAAVLLLLAHVVLVHRMTVVGHRVWPAVIIRSSLLATFVLGLLASTAPWNLLWSSGIALAMGIDFSLTCIDLGWRAQPKAWYSGFLKSGFHMGLAATGACYVLLTGMEALPTVLPVFVTIHVWAGLSFATVWAASNFYWRDHAERELERAAVLDAERKARAHWLHDNVCADLRLVSMRVETSDIQRAEILKLLEGFDHQIRLRQLDELMASGPVSLAELLQPYIRRCQGHGAEVVEVPTFDDASRELPSEPAALLSRAAAVLTSNALNAGATRVDFHVRWLDRSLLLVVGDNGPGFAAEQIMVGRGLWRLSRDLGTGHLDIQPGHLGGTDVTVTIRRT